MQDQQKYRIGVTWKMMAVSVLGTLMFAGATYAGFIYGQTYGLPITIIFTLFFASGIWLSSTSIEITADDIVVTTPHGRYGIKWQEVRSIETDGDVVAFNGENKRLVLSFAFASVKAKDMLEFLDPRIRLREIDVRYEAVVSRVQKNVRL